jgi:hypothetical protein
MTAPNPSDPPTQAHAVPLPYGLCAHIIIRGQPDPQPRPDAPPTPEQLTRAGAARARRRHAAQ